MQHLWNSYPKLKVQERYKKGEQNQLCYINHLEKKQFIYRD